MGSSVKVSDLRFKSMLKSVQGDESFTNAILVFLGALFVLLQFPFYPIPLAFVLAVICGIIGYKMAPLGTIASLLIAIPAVAYQAPLYGWLFIGAIGFILFEVFEFWSIVSYLEIIIFLPFFVQLPLSLLSGFVFLLMTAGSLFVGSKHGRYMLAIAVFMIILFSTLWGVRLPLFPIASSNTYPVSDVLSIGEKSSVGLMDLPSHISGTPGAMFSGEAIENFNLALGIIGTNTFNILFGDLAGLQLLIYVIIFYFIASLPASVRWKNPQAKCSLLMLIIPLYNLFASEVYGYGVESSIITTFYIALSIGIIYVLEEKGVKLSREKYVQRKEKEKSFGKFGVRDLGDSQDGINSLADIGGYEDVKNELLQAILLPLESKELRYAYNLKPPRGIMFFGPPGTGKTLMMKALSKQLKYGFYYVKSSDLLSQWYGESEKNLTELFRTAEKNAPCILFFDEIDGLAKKRDLYSSDDVAPRILGVFLQELDGFATKNEVIVVGATNVPNQIDPALMRPGRFDKLIYMPLPDYDARKAIFEVYVSKLPCDDGIDYARLAKMTERFSGADIKNVVNESKRLAAVEAQKKGIIIPISMNMLMTVAKAVKPSVSISLLEEYDQFSLDYGRRVGDKKEKPDEEKEELITLKDVIGLEGVKQLLKEAIEYPLLHEDEMKKYDVKPMKGIMLFGPPGCGKTLLVKAASNTLNATFIYASCAEFSKKGVQYSANMVKEIFTRAREQAPAIIFMDEVESIAASRDISASPAISQLLTEMDGVKELKNVVVIGATNVPEIIDKALMRPGRFDRVILIPPPDIDARKSMFIQFTKKLEAQGIDYGELARITDGYSGADIAAICQDVKMGFVRAKVKGEARNLSMEIFRKAISARKPSVSKHEMARYLKIYAEFTGDEELKKEIKREFGDVDERHYV